jgi:quinol monooxygenase YgiN
MRTLIYIITVFISVSACTTSAEDGPENVNAGEKNKVIDSIVQPESKNLVCVILNVAENEKSNVQSVLESEAGLPLTRAYEGCISLESMYNEEKNAFVIVTNWESNELYANYLKWRQEVDTTMKSLLIPLLDKETPMVIYTLNSDYKSY